MNTVTKAITLDLTRPGNTPIVYAVQGETCSRSIRISLLSNGIDWTIPENTMLSVRYARLDSTGGYYDTLPDGTAACSFQGNTISIVLAAPMLSISGTVMVQVEMIQGNQLLSTFSFHLIVEPSLSAQILTSDNYIHWLQWLEENLNDYIEQFKMSGEYTGGTMAGPINMNGYAINGLNTPTANDQAANMGFVHQQVRKAAPRNLLDNSDFRNPVNQRGGNNLDRWIFVNSAFSGNTLLSFQSDGIAITNDAGADQVCLYQKFIEKNFDGKTYTAYVLTSNGLYSGYVETIKEDEGMLQCSFWIPTGSKVIWSSIYEGEYTAETLPEYQPKGYGVELAECQRYLQRFRTSDLRKTYCEDFRPTMRMTDTGIVSTFEQSINGVTYYFASTEL